MKQEKEKKDERATITNLVAASEETGDQFFKKPPTDSNLTATSEETADQSFKKPPLEDVVVRTESHDGGKVLIKDRLKSMNMLVHGSKLGPQFADEYRRIKRPLLSNAFGKSSSLVERGNLILITSSIPGEGKTHTAINLALSIAHERDHTVLLVDCDVTRHGTSRALGIADKPGLVDVIESDSFNVGEALLRTDIPELVLLSAGKQHDFVTELLASKKMSELMSELGERYDDRVIIFDGPPLLPTPQTQVLTSLVGQVVFVVEAGKTPQTLVDEALDMISEEQATGLVMNKSEGISSRNSYYYGYYGTEEK